MNNSFSSCLLCGSASLKKLKGYESAMLAKCNSCGFVFSHAAPSEKTLTDHYRNYAPDAVLSEITVKRYNELLDKLEPYRKTNNILDVGCGEGFFLETAKKRDWNVFGTEYREDIIDKCSQKGIHMQIGKLSDKNYSPDTFDVITSFEVIEHINNPKEEINTFHRLLRPGGIAYITTPNFNSLSRILLGNKWNVIEYPEHLSYYTPKTLNSLFNSSGFENTSAQTTGFSISRFRKGLVNSSSGEDETFRMEAETNLFFSLLKKGINTFLGSLNSGDTIKAFYRKY